MSIEKFSGLQEKCALELEILDFYGGVYCQNDLLKTSLWTNKNYRFAIILNS